MIVSLCKFKILENEHIIFHDFECNAWSLEKSEQNCKLGRTSVKMLSLI